MLVMDTGTPEAAAALKKYGAAVTAMLKHLLFLEKIWSQVLRGERRRVNHRNACTSRTLEEELFRASVAATELRQGIELTKESYGEQDAARLRVLDVTFETVMRQWSDFTKRLRKILDRSG